MKFIKLLILGLIVLLPKNVDSTTYGSDTAVSIVNPMNIPTSSDNIIKTFGCAKNGFGFQDLRTSCSFQSIFPVAGPITLKGGTLWLMSDLVMANTGTMADLGSIQGANHVIDLSQYNTTFASGTQPNGKMVLNTAASSTLTRYARSFDWSYDGKYLAVSATGGTGNEFNIYEFTGTSLVLRAGAAISANPDVRSIRWHPSSYYLALVTSNGALRPYLFTPPSTLGAGTAVSGLGTGNYAVAFQKRGTHVAIGGASIAVYPFNATGNGSFGTVITPTNNAALNGTVQYDAMVWAPRGNKNDLIAVTNNAGTAGTVHLYNFTGSALNHLKAYSQTKAANTVDWAATSTYLAVGFSDGTLRTYQHTAATNIIGQKYSNTLTGGVNSVNWKYDASELAVGRASTASNMFQIYAFNNSTYSLSESYPLALTTDTYCVRFYYNSSAKNSYIARSDNSTRLLIAYKESYSPFIMKDVNLFLNSDLTLGAPLSFYGNSSINGRGNKITFTGDGSINVAPGCTLNLSLATLDFKVPGGLSIQGGSADLIFRNVNLDLESDIILADGKFETYDDLTITGPHTFAYSSGYTTTIHSNSMVEFDNGATLKIGKTRATTIEPIAFEDGSANLNFNNATLHTTNSGLSLKRGTVNIFGNSNFNIDWEDTSVAATMQGLKLGDGISLSQSPNLNLYGNGTTLNVNGGGFVWDSKGTYSAINFYGQSQMALSSTSTLYLKQPTRFTNGWFSVSSGMDITVDPLPAYCIFNNTRISDSSNTFDFFLTGTEQTLSSITLDSNDLLRLSSGSTPMQVRINLYGNKITGAGNFVGSLIFQNWRSTLTWDSVSKITYSSDVYLRGGRIALSKDSGLTSNYSFKKTGTVDLSTYTLDFGNVSATWIDNIYWIGSGGAIKFNNDVTLSGIWTFSGSVVVDGNSYLLDLGTTGTIILERGASVEFKNMSLYNFSRRNRIICNDNNCQVTLNFTDIILADDYLWDKGGIYVYYDSTIGILDGLDTKFTFSYASTQTCTISSQCTLEVEPRARLSMGRVRSQNTNISAQPLIFQDPASSALVLNGGTFHVTASGMIMTGGALRAGGIASIEVENTSYPYGLVLGNGVLENDFEIEIVPGADLKLRTGRIFYNNYSNNRIVFDSPESNFSIESNAGLYAKRSILINSGSVSTPLPTSVLTGQDSNKFITYNNAHRFDYAHLQDLYLTATVNPTGTPTIILDSGNNLLLNPGTLTRNILVKQFNNYVTGVGHIGGSISFTDRRSSLTWDLNSSYTTGNIRLNGGRIIYTQDSGLGGAYSFVGTGTIDLTDKTFQCGTESTTWVGNLYWISNGGTIVLNNNVTIDGTWTISGNMTIEGNNYLIDLAPTGSIILEQGAKLTLKDISLYNLSRKNRITCKDNACQIILNIADLLMSDNYLWDKGSIYTYYNSNIGLLDGLDGLYTFSYATTVPATIDSYAFLKIKAGARFSIGRVNSLLTGPTQQPLIFNDPITSKLILDGGTLHVTSSGMILTKGIMEVISSSALEIDNMAYPYGLILGDGTPADDFELKIGGGYQLTLKYGRLFYNNYADERFVFDSPESAINFQAQHSLYAKRNLAIVNGTLTTPNATDVITSKDSNVYITYENVRRYDYGHTQDFVMTGTAIPVPTPTIVLDSNDRILINPGNFNRNIEINQYGNLISGVGNITGNVSFTSWRSTLTWDLSHPYTAGDINLNGGRIIYTQDSGIGPQYAFTGSGTIDLRSTIFNCGELDTTWVGNFYWIGDGATIKFNNNITIDGTWTFSGNVVIDGNGYTLDLNPTGSIILERGANLEFKNIAVYNMSRKNRITCLDNNCLVTINWSDLALAGDYLWDKGSIYVYYDSDIQTCNGFESAYTFSYTSTVPCLVESNCILEIPSGVIFSIGRPNSTVTDPRLQPILFSDPVTSKLVLSGGTLHVTSSGMIMTQGVLAVRNSSNLEIENTVYPYGLILGDGIAADDFELRIGGGCELDIRFGRVFYNNNSTDKIVFDSPESNLFVAENNSLYAKRNITIIDGSISTPLTSSVPVGRDSGVYIVYRNVHRYDSSHILDFYVTGTARAIPTPATILDSNDRLLINPGVFSRPIVVNQYGNLVSGIGSISGTITFNDWRSSLTWDINDKYSSGDIDLKGGRIIYTQDSGLGNGYSFVGTGTIDLTNKYFQCGSEDTTWHGNLYWIGNGGTIELNSNVTIDGDWTLSGDITIEGNNWLIDLAPTGSIILERGARLTLKDVSIYDMSRTNQITCKDDNCQIIMNFSDFIMSDNYLFDKGSIFVYYDSLIGILDGLDGVYTFSYASMQTSTIDSLCSLEIKPNTRFSIGRRNSSITNIDAQPLVFVDPATSRLILNGGTLHVTSSGMIMARGKLDVTNSSNLETENTSYPYGLILGDGDLANDFEIYIGGGYNLNLDSGSVFYNNNSQNRVIFGSSASNLHINSDGGFKAARDVSLQNGTLTSDSTSNNGVITFPGVTASQLGMTRIYSTPYSLQRRNVHGLRPYILNNGDYYYIEEGYTTNDVIANSGTSVFGGSGQFMGTVTLKNRAVTLQSTLDAPCFSNITLNGGTLAYLTDGFFAADKTFTGSGTVQLQETKLAFGSTTEMSLTSSIYLVGASKGAIELNAQKTSLSGTWTVGGEIVLNGKGNVLNFANRGALTIRPNSTLSLENIVIKGLGTNLGSINFMDKTSTLRLANAYLELDNNWSTTNGGIYVDGPTVVGVKNFNWTLDQNASMTVAGCSLWQDPLDKANYGKIKFGSGSIGKYLSLTSSGTIKTMSNLDVLRTDTTSLQNQINQVDPLARTTSNAVVYWTPVNRTTSNSMNYWSPITRTVSNAEKWLDTRVRTDSNTIMYNGQRITNNSNAINYWSPIARTVSNAENWLDARVRTDSNAFTYGIKNNSNAIIRLAAVSPSGLVVQNSNAIAYWSPITRTVSNAENWLDMRVRTDSNAVKFLSDHFVSVNGAKFYTINGMTGATSISDYGVASGVINLLGASLSISKDLHFGSQTTINSSGNFNLNGNSLILDGNLIIPASKYIKVISSGIIDGNNHNFAFDQGAKLIVDSGVTLTLRNLNLLGAVSTNPIEMRAANSKLALQNVVMSFDCDYSFTQGQLYIQDDVLITGSNKFSYASTSSSYIATHSILYFDVDTTFSYSPRQYSRHTLSERNLIKLIDKTSGMYFNQCNIFAPDSGWQITTGSLYFDNKVKVTSGLNTATSFELGNGTTQGELTINVLASAYVDAYGCIYYNTVN